ncbi:MAG TPA: hypothetical protein VHE34_24695 [Puia sp.]|uniref:hypothetical protein n=1 Tax=Puia sp. TaxID=2045100 RepID=UPI002C3C3879|nr:hypothetical protein [Puia sp.]HVU98455.1 hypothetical protein [Puia sp.]
MRGSILLLLVFFAVSAVAQDLDFPDFRNKRDNFAKVSEKDIRADVASFALAGVDESIGKAPLPSLPVLDVGPNFVKYGNDNITVFIKSGIFLPSKHKLMMQEGHLLRIDGKPYYGGVIGQPPHTTIESITVVVGKDTVAVPPTAYFDLYDPKFSFRENGETRSRNGVFLSNDKHTFYIYLLNIDNKGAEYTFVIRDKQYLRRIVDWGFLN